ncbi:hypothetical protein VTK73DRAFT_6089 [Phialemonium thermophilum]|uniref:Uncharacterized protein n=1 Tax=Phialemonium thermophilum TaxID=223376 RepID=A0ABR3WKS7_9PEZI
MLPSSDTSTPLSDMENVETQSSPVAWHEAGASDGGCVSAFFLEVPSFPLDAKPAVVRDVLSRTLPAAVEFVAVLASHEDGDEVAAKEPDEKGGVLTVLLAHPSTAAVRWSAVDAALWRFQPGLVLRVARSSATESSVPGSSWRSEKEARLWTPVARGDAVWLCSRDGWLRAWGWGSFDQDVLDELWVGFCCRSGWDSAGEEEAREGGEEERDKNVGDRISENADEKKKPGEAGDDEEEDKAW